MLLLNFLFQIVKLERNTQTVKTQNKRQQVTVDAATQMVLHNHTTSALVCLCMAYSLQNKTGCFINSRDDRVVPTTGDYERADDYHKRILKKVLKLNAN